MKLNLLVLSALLLTVAACEKVEVPKGKEEMLRGKWKLELTEDKGILKQFTKHPVLDTSVKPIDTLYSVTGKNEIIKDTIYNLNGFPACKLDDFLEFRDGINGALNTGSEKCPQGETTEIPIKWGFLDNYTRMYIYDAGEMFLGNDDLVGDVLDMSESKISLRYMIIRNKVDIPYKDTSFYTVTLLKK